MKKNIGKIIGFIGICVFIVGVSYIVTKYLDKNMYLNTNLLVTFEDNKEFDLESTKKLDKESAILEYPNKFTIENRSLKSVKYDIVIKEIDSNIDLKDLNYILYLNDEEVKSGIIDDVDNILYTSNIGIKKTDSYRLYLYLTKTLDEPKYTYKIEVESI